MRRLPDLFRFYSLLEDLIEMKDANMDVTLLGIPNGNAREFICLFLSKKHPKIESLNHFCKALWRPPYGQRFLMIIP